MAIFRVKADKSLRHPSPLARSPLDPTPNTSGRCVRQIAANATIAQATRPLRHGKCLPLALASPRLLLATQQFGRGRPNIAPLALPTLPNGIRRFQRRFSRFVCHQVGDKNLNTCRERRGIFPETRKFCSKKARTTRGDSDRLLRRPRSAPRKGGVSQTFLRSRPTSCSSVITIYNTCEFCITAAGPRILRYTLPAVFFLQYEQSGPPAICCTQIPRGRAVLLVDGPSRLVIALPARSIIAHNCPSASPSATCTG